MSASRPPLSSRPAFLPDEIARREFATNFRGYDPAEVRTFLNQLSEQQSEQADRVAEMQRNLADIQQQVNSPELDEEMVMKLLGEQTAQILRSAREAANQMRSTAEEEVSKSLREAHEVTSRMRTEAETILAERTSEAQFKADQLKAESTAAANAMVTSAEQDAATMRADSDRYAAELRAEVDAEAQRMRDEQSVELERREAEMNAQMAEELEVFRQRGRDMVDMARAESQLLVDRMVAQQEEQLNVLIRKRKIALAQVEELRAGRQRLLKAYKLVRGTLDEVTEELTRVEDEARQAAGIAGVTAAQSSGIAQEELDTVVQLEEYSLNDDVPQSVIDLINGNEVATETETIDTDQSNEDEDAETKQAGGAGFFDGESSYEFDDEDTDVDIRPADERTMSGADLPGTRDPDRGFDGVDVRGADSASQDQQYLLPESQRPASSSQGSGGPVAMLVQDEVIEAEFVDDEDDIEIDTDVQLQVFADIEPEPEAVPQARVASSFIIGESFATGNAQTDRNIAMRRDAVVTKNRPQTVRRLKRVLQDEQDSVVAQLRTANVTSAAELLGSLDDQATTYQRAIVRLFREVVRAGASSVEGSTGVEPGTIDHAGTNAARFMAQELVKDLRGQLEPVLDELVRGEEMPDANTLQALVAGPYRVLKGEYLEHLVDDRIGGAFDQGVSFATP